MHAELDAAHREEFKKHARKLADRPEALEQVREKTLALAAITKNLWNGFGVWRG